MKHDLIHIQGKPYVLIPLHEYRKMAGDGESAEQSGLPEDLLDHIYAGDKSPIKLIRKYKGMTQENLAQRAGLSRPYLTEIETGKKDGSVSAIRDIAAALNVPVGLLIG